MSKSVELPKMTERHRHREIPEEHRAAQHLDNERTFLAWVRTNVALISLGFVLARLSPSLSAAGAVNAGRIAAKTVPLGIVLVVFGALVTLLAAWSYDRVNREIEAGCVKTDRTLMWFIALAIVLLSAAAVAYMVAE